MSEEDEAPAPRLLSEFAGAGRGLYRLTRFDPDWYEGFDFSAVGFLRSFLAPVLGLPFHLSVGAMIAQLAERQATGTAGLVASTLGYGVDALAFPILAALIARPLGIGQGYSALIVVLNWAGLLLNVMMAGATMLALVGGFGVLQFLGLLLLLLQVYLVWRAARETLTGELGVTMLMVVLWVAVDAGTDQVSGWLAKVL